MPSNQPRKGPRGLSGRLLVLASLTSLVALVGCGVAPGDVDSDQEAASGSGLTGSYYSGTDLATLVKSRVDAQVNFNWGTTAPITGVANTNYSVRWTGKVTSTKAGSYTFTTTSDDGVRLWVNGQELINDWTTHAAKADSGSITLAASTSYDVKLEYFQGGGKSVAQLAWTPPGGTSAIIPSANLAPAGSTGPTTGISIQNHQLMRDGKAWAPHGMSMIGSLSCGSANTAYSHWGQAEINAAKSWGADAFRFQVSQPLLDPQSSKYQASYLTKIQNMVSLSTQNGFAVILSMQDQSLACGDAEPLPTTSTVRAWAALAPIFATNTSVIYELYNEPQNDDSASGWNDWENGKSGTVGHQALLNDVRASGAKNVILVDGANHAELLTGIPILKDPLNQTGYATHPYYVGAINSDPNAFQKRFGFLAATQAVVITEWGENTNTGGCSSTDPVNAQKLVNYAKQLGVGIFGWSFDLPGTIITGWTWAPNTTSPWVCGQGDNGTGQMIETYFKS